MGRRSTQGDHHAASEMHPWPPPWSNRHGLPKKQAEAALGDLVTLTTRHLRKGDKLLMGMAICARLDLPISVKRGTKPPPLSRRGIDQSGNSA
jgi:predicted TIM-barrel fold metal-dependent hydrolase